MRKVILVVAVTMLAACNSGTTAVETDTVDSVEIDTTLVPAQDSLLVGENVQ